MAGETMTVVIAHRIEVEGTLFTPGQIAVVSQTLGRRLINSGYALPSSGSPTPPETTEYEPFIPPPTSDVLSKFLRGDKTWAVPAQSTPSLDVNPTATFEDGLD